MLEKLPDILFIIAALAAVASAVKVVSSAKPLYCALYFVPLVISTAVLVLLLGGQFLAAAMILIYAGAIIVVYIFVIMLAQGEEVPIQKKIPRIVFTLVSTLVLAGMIVLLAPDASLSSPDWKQSNVSAIGKNILIDHVVTLELAGVLLLAAVIGAVAIAKKPTGETEP
jgi:NADH-quinone oxidoreductase subunit J